jgi:hypothetical protein
MQARIKRAYLGGNTSTTCGFFLRGRGSRGLFHIGAGSSARLLMAATVA